VDLEPIIKYFESTWINGTEQFKPSVWNHFEFIGPTTNGDLEGMNRQMNKQITSTKSNIYAFVNRIKNIDMNMTSLAIEIKDNPLLVTKSKDKRPRDKEAKFRDLNWSAIA